MTTDQDLDTRIVLSWLREETHENAERVLLRALDEVDTTPQRRSWWPAWRTDHMTTYAKLIAGAAAVLVVAAVGYQSLPGESGSGGTTATPSPALLARGSFKWKGTPVELEATAEGSSVTGSMIGATEPGGFTVALQCTKTTEDGLIVIAGDTTASTTLTTYEGTRAGITFKRGSPVHAVMFFQRDAPRAASCLTFIDSWLAYDIDIDHPSFVIEGTVELGP